MKIAYLLMLYAEPRLSNLFISQLLASENSTVFIHYDSKRYYFSELLIEDSRVILLKDSFNVQWGDYSQIETILLLLRRAKEYGDFDYYSLHSDSDLLIKSIKEFENYLAQSNAYAYLGCGKMPLNGWGYGGGMGRIALTWPRFTRKKCGYYSPIRVLRSLYGKAYGAGLIKGKKLPRDITFWGGYDWITISAECVSDILEYCDVNSWYKKMFINSLVGVEIFFNTIICNANTNKKLITDNTLRYIDFCKASKKHPGSPKILTIDDIDKIESTKNVFFARKFNLETDHSIVEYFLNKTSNSTHHSI